MPSFGDVAAQRIALVTPHNAFRRIWDLGYPRLVPIIPPDAPISEKSVLHSRVGTHQDGRGKTPGIRGVNGLWFSFDWTNHEADETDLDRWHTMGAGVGIKTGDLGDGTCLVGVDVDTTDPARAAIIAAAIERRFGLLPIRYGRDPKGLLPLRVRGRFQYSRIEFGDPKERLEILSDGRQFVAHGIHPKTRRPYRWERALPPLSELPIVEEADLLALLDELKALLPAASRTIREGGGAEVDQALLRGAPDIVRRAVEATPNTTAAFPSREDFLGFGYAIKGALPDDPALALELFHEWALRWIDPPDGKSNDPDWIEGEWRRMRAPYRVGAGKLFRLAEELSGGRFTRAEQWFEPREDVEPLFPDEPSADAKPVAAIDWVDPEAWADKPIPTREWEVKDLIPRHEVTLLYGDGGIGKTLLMHQYAVAASAGVPWLGQETRPARVMCFFCEDSEDELQRRHADILQSLGLKHSDTSGKLRIASRRHVDNLLATWNRNTGEMTRLPIWKRLAADAKAFGANVVILDTIADIFAGEEQNRAQVTAFVKACLGKLAQEIGGSVIALGHPSQAGKTSGEGTSGSTGWSNAVRSRLYLSYPSGTTSGNIRELETKKLNYGAKGAKLKIRWSRGAFEVIASSMPSVQRTASAGAAGVASLNDVAETAVLDAIAAHPDVRISLTARTGAYVAVNVLRKREPELLQAFTASEIDAALVRLEAADVIANVEIGRDTSRRIILGVRINQDKLSARQASEGGVFE